MFSMSVLSRALACLAVVALSVSCAAGVKVPTKPLVVGYYYPYGKAPDCPPFKTISQNTSNISVISPTWFLVKDVDCTTEDTRDTTLSDFCVKNGMKVWPLIANGNFVYKSFHPLISDPANREKLVAKTVDVMSSCKDCEAINIDLEGISPEDRDAFSDYVKQVSARLHAKGYLVTIDVPAKTKDDPSARWPGAFDYKVIGEYCDYVCIMTYDEHVPRYDAGPISSVPWTDQVMAYATSVIPREKILMGVPFYGYAWAEDKSAIGVSYTQAAEIIAKPGTKLQWDDVAKVPFYTYTDDKGKNRIAYFENSRSIAEKLKVAKKHKVAGLCIWSMGDEDPEIWKEIAKYRDGK